MKKFFWRLGWIGLGVFSFAENLLVAAPAGLVEAQYHFAGSASFLDNTNFAKLQKIWALPESVKFRDLILRAVAANPGKLLPKSADAKFDSAALVRPLLDDWLTAESSGSFGGSTNAPEFVLAIKLDKERAELWQKNLLQIMAGAKYTTGLPGLDGWVAKKNHASSFRFVRTKDWVVINSGELQSDFLNVIGKTGRPRAALQTNSFEAQINWPWAQGWLGLDSIPLKIGRAEISISGKAGYLRTTARVTYPQNFQWKSAPWQIPINTLRDPIVSFTAGQNLTPFLKEPKRLASLKLNSLTNQFFCWAQADLPFQTFLAVPTERAKNAVQDLSAKLPAAFNSDLKRDQHGELRWLSEKNELAWQGLPIIVPSLKPLREKNGEYLFLATFPPAPRTNAAPGELLAQIEGRNNLLYYDWELTGVRLQQWRMLSELLPIFPEASPNAPAMRVRNSSIIQDKWFSAVAPLLDNSVTEITRTGPNELSFLRKSPLGLTGLEIILLAHWASEAAPVKHAILPPPTSAVSHGKTEKKP